MNPGYSLRSQESQRDRHGIVKTGFGWQIYLALIVLFLVECNTTPPNQHPPPTPQVVRIALPPSLTSYGKSVYSCAKPITGLAVFIDEVSAIPEDRAVYDLSITFGSLPGISGFSYQLKTEQLEILVNPANPIKGISFPALEDIYKGTVRRWDEVDPLAGFHEPVQVINYPSGSDLGTFFSNTINLHGPSPAETLIVPAPGAMIEQVARQLGAIGFAPSSWLAGDSQVKTLVLDSQLAENLSQPVLASTKEKPQGAMVALLDCLQ